MEKDARITWPLPLRHPENSISPPMGASLLAMNDNAVFLKNRVVFIASRLAPTLLDEYSS
ncbi:hypothetical protein ACYZUA_26010 [Pseudomonas sp. LS2P72]